MGKMLAAQGPELDSQCKKPGVERQTPEVNPSCYLHGPSLPSPRGASLCLDISPGRVLVPICTLKALRNRAVPQQCRRWVLLAAWAVWSLCVSSPKLTASRRTLAAFKHISQAQKSERQTASSHDSETGGGAARIQIFCLKN